MIIPESYYKKEKQINLTEAEIDRIIEELERAPHNIFKFYSYDGMIKKLKRGREWNQKLT